MSTISSILLARLCNRFSGWESMNVFVTYTSKIVKRKTGIKYYQLRPISNNNKISKTQSVFGESIDSPKIHIYTCYDIFLTVVNVERTYFRLFHSFPIEHNNSVWEIFSRDLQSMRLNTAQLRIEREKKKPVWFTRRIDLILYYFHCWTLTTIFVIAKILLPELDFQMHVSNGKSNELNATKRNIFCI